MICNLFPSCCIIPSLQVQTYFCVQQTEERNDLYFFISRDANPRESLLIWLLCILLGVLRLHKHFCQRWKTWQTIKKERKKKQLLVFIVPEAAAKVCAMYKNHHGYVRGLMVSEEMQRQLQSLHEFNSLCKEKKKSQWIMTHLKKIPFVISVWEQFY